MKKTKNSKTPPGAQGITKKTTATVLHIDDDPNDTELLEAAMRKAQVDFTLQTVIDGDQAMAYLNGEGAFANRTRYQIPSLVLLDLKMPRATGFEVLRWIRAHPLFGRVPVVVLSGSQLKDDIQAAYSAGANSYEVKPLGFTELVSLVKDLNHAWLTGKTDAKRPERLALPNASATDSPLLRPQQQLGVRPDSL
jgi:CheY-like chemotaxis protein